MEKTNFNVSYDTKSGGLTSLTVGGDTLNWVDGEHAFGTPFGVYRLLSAHPTSDGFRAEYSAYDATMRTEFTHKDNRLRMTVRLSAQQDVEIPALSAGVATPFNDSYSSADVCYRQRCHAHVWCADNVCYIAGKRMNGTGQNIALALTRGSVDDYAVTRKENSNDRGDFFLLFPALRLCAGEEAVLEFEFLTFDTFDDLREKLTSLPQTMLIEAEKYSLSVGETCEITLKCAHADSAETDFGTIPFQNGVAKTRISYDKAGEYRLRLRYGACTTYAEFYVHDGLLSQLGKRIDFIIEKQQVRGGKLDGAIMLYDNETQSQYAEIRPVNDRNLARERMGMVVSMMEYAMRVPLPEERAVKIRKAVTAHLNFLDRNIFKKNGRVCESPKYKNMLFYHRLYNYSWAMLVCVTAYRYLDDRRWLDKACTVAKFYYRCGGAGFYAINLPFRQIVEALETCGATAQAAEMKALFLRHGDRVCEIGVDYPAHEVKYEQSIVAPSVDILLECYAISGQEKYLDEAKRQLPYLEAFNGEQPSFHNNNVAIRHWDGFWFGKRKLYGDTFPHYWSCITAGVFRKFADITGDKEYARRARICLENNLCLIRNGVGSCAYVRPALVNGQRGGFYDPWANDQDWLMWFNLRYNPALAD